MIFPSSRMRMSSIARRVDRRSATDAAKVELPDRGGTLMVEDTLRPCRLLALPVELINLVLENFIIFTSSSEKHAVIFTSDQETLARICRVNSYSRELAEPLLYRTYTKPTNLSTPYEDYQPNHNLRSFVRSLHTRVELREHVRHIYLGEWETKSGLLDFNTDIRDLHSIFNKWWHSLLGVAHEGLTLRTRDNGEWTTSLFGGIEDAEIAMLLLYSPRLESLTINLPKIKYRSREASYLESIVDMLAQSSRHHGFLRLERVNFFNPQSEATGRLSESKANVRQGIQYAFLHLPALTTYYAEGDQPLKNSRSAIPSALRDLRPCSTAVRSIVLRQCDLPISDISKLIQSCKRLETFELGMGCQERQLRHDHVTWPQLLFALQPARETLRELTLGTVRRCWLEVGTYYCDDDSVLPWRPLGSLRHLTALRVLTIDQTALLGLHTHESFQSEGDWSHVAPSLAELLPLGLEKLSIRDATCQTVNALSLLSLDMRPSGSSGRRALHTVVLVPLSSEELALLRPRFSVSVAQAPSSGEVHRRLRVFCAVESNLMGAGVRLVVTLLSEHDTRNLDPCNRGRVAALTQICSL